MSEYSDSAAFTLDHEDRPGIIVALHGLTGSRAQPLSYLAGLDVPDFGVLAPDLRAHGETAFIGRPADFTAVQLAADVTALVHELGLASKRICLLGVSLGATVALELVREGSLDILAAVYVRPAHTAEPPAHLDANLLIASYLRENPATALGRLLESDAYRRVAAVSTSAAANLRDKAGKDRSAERAMRLEMGSWTAFRPGERVETAIPSLIVAAVGDPLHPIAAAEEWQARIDNSTLVTVPSRDADPAGNLAAAFEAIREFMTVHLASETRLP